MKHLLKATVKHKHNGSSEQDVIGKFKSLLADLLSNTSKALIIDKFSTEVHWSPSVSYKGEIVYAPELDSISIQCRIIYLDKNRDVAAKDINEIYHELERVGRLILE